MYFIKFDIELRVILRKKRLNNELKKALEERWPPPSSSFLCILGLTPVV